MVEVTKSPLLVLSLLSPPVELRIADFFVLRSGRLCYPCCRGVGVAGFTVVLLLLLLRLLRLLRNGCGHARFCAFHSNLAWLILPAVKGTAVYSRTGNLKNGLKH